MAELKELRLYNAKSFGDVAEGGIHTQEISVGPIHYDNKLGVGDGRAGFREIDNSLSFVELPNRRGWTFQFNNYQPLAPEYADEWILYRDLFKKKDQVTGFRARTANHVLGRLVPNVPGLTMQNAVVYDDAFGTGIDLIIAFTYRKMLKIVRIRDGFKPNVDTDFDFEIKYPDLVNVYEEDPDTKTLSPIVAGEPLVLKARSRIFIGTDQLDGDEWFTRVNPVRVWDSGTVTGIGTGKKSNIAPAAIIVAGGKTFLRKRVTAAFLATCVGDVFTDAVFAYTETKDTYYGTAFTTGGNPDGDSLNTGGWGDNYYSFIEWDLTGTLNATNTHKAYVKLSCTQIATNDSVSRLQVVTASWTEAGVTSAANPTATTTNEVAFPNMQTVKALNGGSVAGNPRVMIDWTLNYQQWKNAIISNFGVKIDGDEGPEDAAHSFASSDHANPELHPLLIVSTAPMLFGNRVRTPNGMSASDRAL